MGVLLHATSPSPALVQSTSIPSSSQTYRLPNWFATVRSFFCPPKMGGQLIESYFWVIGWAQHERSPGPALVTMNSEPQLLQE